MPLCSRIRCVPPRTLHHSMYIWCPSSTLVRIMLAYFLAIYIAVDCFSPAVYSIQTYPKLAYEYASNFFGVPTELYILYRCALHIHTYLVGWLVGKLDRAHFLSEHRLTFCLSLNHTLTLFNTVSLWNIYLKFEEYNMLIRCVGKRRNDAENRLRCLPIQISYFHLFDM